MKTAIVFLRRSQRPGRSAEVWVILGMMPFTLSHAAAAIPFRRTPLIMSAVVIGCFAPDFPYLFSLLPRVSIGHTFAGIFVFDLPLGIAALWLFHTFVKEPMLMFLPAPFRRRVTTSVNSFRFWPPGRLWMIVLSILVGTTTHLLWDAFTHCNSWIGQNWALLRGEVKLPITGEIQVCTLLEYGSSLFGLALVAAWIWLWYRTTKPSVTALAHPVNAPHEMAFVVILPVLAAFIGALRGYQENGIHPQIRPLVHFVADSLISAITLFLLGLFVYGVILRRYRTDPVGD
jgi:hypothetical protein